MGNDTGKTGGVTNQPSCAETIAKRAEEGASLDRVLDEVLPACPQLSIDTVEDMYWAKRVALKQLEQQKAPVVSNPVLAPATGPKAPKPARIGAARLWRLTPKVVDDTIERYRGDIGKAYEGALKRDPILAGIIVFNVTVGNDGKVVSIEPKEEPTPKNAEMIKNIENVFKRTVRFPEFSDTSIEQVIEIPLLLSPN